MNQIMTSLPTPPTPPRPTGMQGFDIKVRDLLEQKFPPEQIRHDLRRNDGFEPVYVEAHNIIQRLNDAFGGVWTFKVLDHFFVPPNGMPSQVVVKGELSVPCDEDDAELVVVKQQFGSCFVRCQNGVTTDIGSDLKAAATDALKKCATMLGVALELYQRDEAAPQGLTRMNAQADRGSFPAVQADPQAPAQEFQIKAVREMFARLGVGDGWWQQLGFHSVSEIKVGHVNALLSGQHAWVQELIQKTGKQVGLQASAA